ncbi:TetR family transcriptional regulator [Phycicoccus sp. CSK15P-2]|uniref:TetR family transcriptional regulator n=1 Tax=Phycicoccus sp. CSK15P-2 TaxID=2807627 RepID=UPI0019515E38|nr:TetR family transcriptional regulator [Phycicoccus sp. CSK15P-2]MBM6402985.1 TetR family transcriptional regulator [Phycicoccus sp. CSK15P-2]
MTSDSTGRPRSGRRDAAATRARLLASARAEFAERGLAGARVDRIAEQAETNKRMIYVYFGSKQGLFDAVIDTTIGRLLDEVPFTADDLPAYVGGYFDQLVADPEALRLTMWRSVEHVEPTAPERESFARKLAAIRSAQAEGKVRDDIAAVDLLAMLLALARGWLTATPALHSAVDSDPHGAARLAEHRAAVVDAVHRALGPYSR